MNYKTTIAIILCIAALAALFAGCASAPTQTSTDTQVSGSGATPTASNSSSDLALVTQQDTDIGTMV